MKLAIRTGLKMMTLAGIALAATIGSGCAIHSQSPIKEVAYDFSDYDFYDRAYAASPDYASKYAEGELRERKVAKTDAKAAPEGKRLVWLPAYVLEPKATKQPAADAAAEVIVRMPQ